MSNVVSCEAFRFSVTVEVHSNRRLQSDDMSVCVLKVTFLHLNNITSYYSKQKEVIQERSSVVIRSVCPVRNSPEAGVLLLLGAVVVPVLLENTPSHMTWSLEFGLYFPTMKTLSGVVVAGLVWRDKNFGLHMRQCADVVPPEGSTYTIFEYFLWRTVQLCGYQPQ